MLYIGRLKEMLVDAVRLPSGVAAKVAEHSSSIQLAAALISDDSQGRLLGAMCIEADMNGLQDVVIY